MPLHAPSPTLIAITLCLALIHLSQLCSANCFAPNGSDRNAQVGSPDGWDYAPCDNIAPVSMCCAIGPGRAGSQDTCRPDGTCFNSGGNVYWRESCTDQTWTDPACVKLYLNESLGSDPKNIDVLLTLCEDGSYCDGSGPSGIACCSARLGYFIGVNGTQTRTNPNATTSSSTSSATASSTSHSSTTTVTLPASPTATSSPSSGGLSTGAKAGIGVGVALGVVGALIAVGIFTYSRHSSRSRAARDDKYTPVNRDGSPGRDPLELPPDKLYQPPAELEQPARRASGTTQEPIEMGP